MAENTNSKVDMSSIAFELAKSKGFGSDEAKFKEWEKEFIRKFYEVIGLSDIPDEFLNFTKFIDSYSGVLVKSVQNDLAIMQLTKRLAMFKLSENISQTSDKPTSEAVPDAVPDASASFDPLAK